MKKSIAIFVQTLTSGGAEKQSVLLAKSLSRSYDVHYIIFNAKYIHQKYMYMLNEDNRIKIIGFTGNRLRCFGQFVHYLKSNRIAAIFAYLTAADAYAGLAGLLHKMRVFTGLRNAELPLHKLWVDRLVTNRLAYCGIANSYAGRTNFIAKGFKPNNITVITNCFEHIKPYNEKAISSCPHIITVGRFVAQKDYETAIKTIVKVRDSGRNLHFDIVGYGLLEKEVRGMVQAYGIEDITTIYINPNNISELLDKADIYISTSLFEGTSNSIMEAMNADLPVVCTDVGDNSKLILDGISGYICEKRNVKKLATCINKLLECPELRLIMGKRGKEHLADDYSMGKFRESYIKLIEA